MKTVRNILVSCLISIFAIVTAQAGELSVTGGMKIANTKKGGTDTGNGLGQDTELTFSGSTELENGIKASYKQTVTDSFGFNDSELMFATNFGTIGLSSTGGSIEDIDNIVPTAYEEAEALIGFAATGFLDVGLNDGTYGIVYKNAVPGTGMNLTAFYAPKGETGDAATDDGVSGAVTSDNDKAYSIYLRGNPLGLIDGIDLAVGYETSATHAASAVEEDAESVTAALNYAYGPVKVGVQGGWLSAGSQAQTAAEGYKNTYVGIAYAINDNLSVSYQNTKSTKVNWNGSSVQTDIDGYSVAYTMGGATIAYVQNKAKNADYTADKELTGNQIAIALAF